MTRLPKAKYSAIATLVDSAGRRHPDGFYNFPAEVKCQTCYWT
jgi:hypothetical protein